MILDFAHFKCMVDGWRRGWVRFPGLGWWFRWTAEPPVFSERNGLSEQPVVSIRGWRFFIKREVAA